MLSRIYTPQKELNAHTGIVNTHFNGLIRPGRCRNLPCFYFESCLTFTGLFSILDLKGPDYPPWNKGFSSWFCFDLWFCVAHLRPAAAWVGVRAPQVFNDSASICSISRSTHSIFHRKSPLRSVVTQQVSFGISTSFSRVDTKNASGVQGSPWLRGAHATEG